MYNLENDIKLINTLRNSIESKATAYCSLFKLALEMFLKENALDGDVIRNDKDTGILEISETENVVTLTDTGVAIGIPYCVTFRPYKKDGTLSNMHRIDHDIDTSSLTAYLDALTKIYCPFKS